MLVHQRVCLCLCFFSISVVTQLPSQAVYGASPAQLFRALARAPTSSWIGLEDRGQSLKHPQEIIEPTYHKYKKYQNKYNIVYTYK